MSLHAKLSPSSAHRWMRCPGSVRACVGMPDEDSEWSREGTFAHGVAALCLEEDEPAAHYLGHSDGEFRVDEEMAAHIQVYVNAVEKTRALDGGELAVEQRVELSADVWGTADAILVDGEVLHVFDLKFGRGYLVLPWGNPQLRIYGLAALRRTSKNIKTVHLHIVQPRRPDGDGETWRTETLDAEALFDYQREVLRAAEATYEPDAPLVPGEHCKFCPARASCAALRDAAHEAAAEVFPVVLDEEERVAPPVIETISTERLLAIYRAADTVEQWIKAVRQEMLRRAHAETIPGMKLVATIGNRKWKLDLEATTFLRRSGVDPYDRKLISPSEAVRRLHAAMKPAKVSKKKVEEILDPLIERPVTGAKLVSDTDPRPALDAGAVFPMIEDNEP